MALLSGSTYLKRLVAEVSDFWSGIEDSKDCELFRFDIATSTMVEKRTKSQEKQSTLTYELILMFGDLSALPQLPLVPKRERHRLARDSPFLLLVAEPTTLNRQ